MNPSKQAPTPAPTLDRTVLGIAPEAANAMLMLLARTLQEQVLPALQGKARSAAQDCMTIAVRLAQQLVAEGGEADRQLRVASCAEEEGRALDLAEAEAVQIASSLATPTPAVRTTGGTEIETYLRGHLLGGPDLHITSARALSGGRSKQTILVTQEGANALPSSFVVRQDWLAAQQEWAKDATTAVVTEFEVLAHLHALGMRVPKPLLVEPNRSALGAPFLVLGAMPGCQEGDLFFPPRSPALAHQVAQQMALLHRAPTAAIARKAGLRVGAHEPDELRRTLGEWRAVVARLDAPSHTLQSALDWLEGHVPDEPAPLVLVHGDVGFHNLLVDGDTLTAVLDWELVHLGAAAQDLGYLRSGIEKMTSWDDFMAAYRAAGGPEVDAKVLDFYTVWGSMWLYSVLLQARAGVVAGMLRDSEVAVFCMHFLQVLRQRLSHELRRAMKITMH